MSNVVFKCFMVKGVVKFIVTVKEKRPGYRV